MNKIFKILFDIVFVIAIIALGIYFVLRIMNIAQIYKVKTGSMEDGIHAGDYIFVYKKNNYNIGDVVTYKKDDYYITHRIVKKNGNKIVTKGDANNNEDQEITTSAIVGQAIYTGGFLNILINYKFVIATLLLGLYLLSCYFEDKDKKEAKEDKSEGKS